MVLTMLLLATRKRGIGSGDGGRGDGGLGNVRFLLQCLITRELAYKRFSFKPFTVRLLCYPCTPRGIADCTFCGDDYIKNYVEPIESFNGKSGIYVAASPFDALFGLLLNIYFVLIPPFN